MSRDRRRRQAIGRHGRQAIGRCLGVAYGVLVLFVLPALLAGEGAEELLRALVGGIGLVASVPITTALAAVVVAGRSTRR